MQLFLLTFSIVMIAARPAVDVEKTVLQVQSILQANSQLPRLTRQEILELLNDIRAEDSKSSSTSSERTSTEKLTTTTPSSKENEAIPSTTAVPDLTDNLVSEERDSYVSAAGPTETTVESTTKAQPTLTVVLPYTPRDGSSLQELYTRPPRTEVVALPKTTPKPTNVLKNEKLEQTLKNNHDLALENIQEFSAELQAFLDAHGLKSNSGKDNFLLPLDGFKPLPPAKIVDGTVQLPENILLTYDLISPSVEFNSSATIGNQALNNYLYEPLRPEFPFELDTSESQKVDLPLDMPKNRKTKSSNSDPQPLLEPFDYDSVKVIPLGQGPNPFEETKGIIGSEQSKRQANSTEDVEASTTTVATDLKDNSGVSDNAASSADADSGASITDLEESFGGAAPEKPGDSELPPPRKNGFYWMVDWNSFLEVGDGDTKVNIRFEPKLGDPQMFLPVSVP